MSGRSVELPALEGFEVVVVSAEAGEVVEVGVVGEGPGGDVVDFEVGVGVAAGDDAVGVSGGQGGALAGGDGASEVDDVVDVVVFVLLCNDRGEEGVGGVVAGYGDGYGSGAVDFAGFAGLEVAAGEGGVVDSHDDRGGRPPGRWPGWMADWRTRRGVG